MPTTSNPTPRYVRDAAGKKASVRKTYRPADDLVAQDETWTWFVEPKSGRYYVVATDVVNPAEFAEPVAEVVEIAPKRARKAAKAAKVVEPKALVAVKSIAPSAADRLGETDGDFIVRWPKGGADLLQRVAGEGTPWLVRCNAHGTTTEAPNVKLADVAGRKAQRVVWCPGCAEA